MTFRDDREAQKNRIDALEDELQAARAEAEALREERDAALEGPTDGSAFRKGSAVWVEWNHRWYRATVLRAVTDDLWEIHYDGWSSKWDEAVGKQRIAPGHLPAPGRVATTVRPPVAAVLLFVTIAVGSALWWWGSRPLTNMGGIAPSGAASPAPGYAPLDPTLAYEGEPVWIVWNGSWYPGTILRIDAPGSYVVHYDGWPTSSDERVTVDRLSERR